VLSLILRFWPGKWLLRSCNVCLGLQPQTIWADSGLSGGCSSSLISKLLDAMFWLRSGNWNLRNLFFRYAESFGRRTTQHCGYPLPRFSLRNKDRKANEKILNREAALRDIQKDCCKADYISRWFRVFFFRIHRGNSWLVLNCLWAINWTVLNTIFSLSYLSLKRFGGRVYFTWLNKHKS